MLTQVLRRIDHVAIAVHSLDSALAFYEGVLGIQPSRIVEFPAEGVRIAFLPLADPSSSEIELLEATDATAGVARFLQSRGEGLHHICLEVADIDAALNELRACGAALLDASPRKTADGRGLFLHPKGASGVLVELVQRD